MSFNELQQQVAQYDKIFGWVGDKPEHTVLHMQEEIGEISREILKALKYKGDEYDRERLNDELSDLLYLTLKLGNLLNLDLDDGWSRIQKRYDGK